MSNPDNLPPGPQVIVLLQRSHAWSETFIASETAFLELTVGARTLSLADLPRRPPLRGIRRLSSIWHRVRALDPSLPLITSAVLSGRILRLYPMLLGGVPIHLHAHWRLPTVASTVLRELLNATLTISVHAHESIFGPEYLTACSREANRVFVCNSATLRRVKSLCDDNSKVQLIYHGVAQIPRRDRATTDRLRCVAVGRLTPTKRLDYLLQSFALAHSRGARVELTIVGDGGQREELEGLVEALDLGEVVAFAGVLSHEQVLHALPDFDVLLSTPELHGGDGLPNVVLEGLAAGLTVISSALEAVKLDLCPGNALRVLEEPLSTQSLARLLMELGRRDEEACRLAEQEAAQMASQFDRQHWHSVLAAAIRSAHSP